jgi:o-succinylbenzoate synthase
MKLIYACVTPVELPLRSPLATAHGSLISRAGVVVQLVAADAVTGYGEAMPIAGFGLEAPAQTRDAVALAVGALMEDDLADLDAALACVESATRAAPSARAGLDFALHDLFARAAGRSVAALLCAGSHSAPHASLPVNALILPESAAAAARHARQAVSRGFRALKLKLGVGDPDLDVARVAAVRAAVGPNVELRLDANAAWDEATALRTLERLARLEPAFIEEPLAARDPRALARLRAAALLPIAADESASDLGHVRALLEAEAVDFVIVKPAALGGLRPARQIAACARAAGVPVVVTGFLDAALGTAAALHFAASLPAPLRAAGLATDRLLLQDLAALPRVSEGARALPEGPGLGVLPSPKALRQHASGPAQTWGAAC